MIIESFVNQEIDYLPIFFFDRDVGEQYTSEKVMVNEDNIFKFYEDLKLRNNINLTAIYGDHDEINKLINLC